MSGDPPNGVVIVAHPDDETLWCGGFLLRRADVRWTIVALCRASDRDRAPRFNRAAARYGAATSIGDLDDGPGQQPIELDEVRAAIERLLPPVGYDIALTHGPLGEYTRHRRHEECCRAVCQLWAAGVLRARRLKMFAFGDGGRAHLPQVRADADERFALSPDEYEAKRLIITDIYGFAPDSWEARAVSATEGFRNFTSPPEALGFIHRMEVPA